MKKFLAILMAICLMASVLCVPALAAEPTDEPAAGTVLRATALLKDGKTIEFIGDYNNFEAGWNAAMDIAESPSEMATKGYDRIVVDIYADWNAVNGNFTDDAWYETNGPGFNNDTIYIPDDARVTLNLNGHTINRGLTHTHSDGEVIYVDEDADFIINGGTNGGTITGGYSDNGAGGIHIKKGANVTLNNVHILGNHSISDNGAGISLVDATLTMNGGSIKDNLLYEGNGGAIYAEDSTVFLNNVEIKNNQTLTDNTHGAAIYADDSAFVLNECTIDGNGIKDEAKKFYAASSIIYGVDSSISIKKSTFVNNGDMTYKEISNGTVKPYITDVSSLFSLNETTLTIEDGSDLSNNKTGYLIKTTSDSMLGISDSTFKDNKSIVLYSVDHLDESYFQNCTFNNNKSPYAKTISNVAYTFNVMDNSITFYDCNMGDSTIDKNDADYIRYAYTSVPQDEALIRVSALDSEGTTVFSNYYKELAYGWNAAIEEAMTGKYDRIVVDLYADWNAVNGEFCNFGEGFDYDAIFFPANVHVTLNMNGHTINRGMTTWEYNGEVMCVNNNADVIINDGTITGGWSSNGAGGIHIHDGAKVTLNNVNVVGNKTEDDDGAGIAVYDGATLKMNGGSLKNNIVMEGSEPSNHSMDFGIISYYGGAVYVEDSTAIFKGVEFKNNNIFAKEYGAAIYADNSNVTIDECNFDGNGTWNKANGEHASKDVIHGVDSSFTIKNSTFTNSESVDLFYFEDSSLTMEGCKVTGNNVDEIFSFEDSKADLKGVTITDNASRVIYVDNGSEKVTMTQCTLNNNTPADGAADIKVETKGTLVVTDCDLGDTTFENKNMVTGVGSMIGEGNISMILSLLAIFVAGAAFTVVISKGKKKGSPYAVAVASDLGSDE